MAIQLIDPTTHGYLAIVLTAHVPYVRSVGRRPDGEDLLHETIAYAIIPTLNTLFDLRDVGLHSRVAIAYSPVLLEQLADSIVQKHFTLWMEQWLENTTAEAQRCRQAGDEHHAYLARFYLDWGEGILHSFTDRYRRNLIAALRELCDDGIAEPLAGAATHAYLPLLGRSESVRAQLDVGTLTVTKRLGRRPRGLWLPECAYHPNLEQHIIANDTQYLIVDPSSIPGDVGASHLRPRWVAPRRLAAFIRDEVAAQQVWSFELGYPGDPLYLSPQRDVQANLAYWRNGAPAHPQLEMYDPYHAFRRAQEHADHFVTFAATELNTFRQQHDRPGIAVVPLDAELLGRRWFEGPAWLRAMLSKTVEHPAVDLTSIGAYLRTHRPRRRVTLREGSWGTNDQRILLSHAALDLWQALHEMEEQLAVIAQQFPKVTGFRERALTQAMRELLLAQSSDWPLLLGQGETPEAVLEHPYRHLRHTNKLCQIIYQTEASDEDIALLDDLEERNNPFPDLNYRVFA
jgi:1,4-alpha-glucan branching enzyme